MCVFFFKQKTAYELRISYWSSDVCSSDLALEAEVELASRDGLRRLALDAFILGNRKTARRPDELVTAIIVPKPSGRARSRFLKLGARKYLVISIVMVATLLDLDDDGRVATARVAVGSCAARAQRLPAVEAAPAGPPFAPHLLPLRSAHRRV